VKVYVCPQHLSVAGVELSRRTKVLTDQLNLFILDTKVSVSDSGDRGTDGEYKA